MIFGKIDYVNLLPFYVFLNKNINSSQQKAMMNYKKSFPSHINKMFHSRTIDGAFISSIKTADKKCADIGIVSHDEVFSVLCIKGEFIEDIESNSSNMLAKVLNLDGQVVIGDKALTRYFQTQNDDFVDMGASWSDKYRLPFVYARLCFCKRDKIFMQLTEKFLRQKTKIPSYILNKSAKKIGISPSQLKHYLTKISYKIGHKEKRSLKLFLKLSKTYM